MTVALIMPLMILTMLNNVIAIMIMMINAHYE